MEIIENGLNRFSALNRIVLKISTKNDQRNMIYRVQSICWGKIVCTWLAVISLKILCNASVGKFWTDVESYLPELLLFDARITKILVKPINPLVPGVH